MVMPRPKDRGFKLQTYKKTKTVKKVTFLEEIPEEQERQLERTTFADPLVQRLMSQEMILLALGSSTF